MKMKKDMMPGDLLFVENLADVFCYRLEQRPDNENEGDHPCQKTPGSQNVEGLTSQGFGFIAEHELQNKTKLESGL